MLKSWHKLKSKMIQNLFGLQVFHKAPWHTATNLWRISGCNVCIFFCRCMIIYRDGNFYTPMSISFLNWFNYAIKGHLFIAAMYLPETECLVCVSMYQCVLREGATIHIHVIIYLHRWDVGVNVCMSFQVWGLTSSAIQLPFNLEIPHLPTLNRMQFKSRSQT